MFPHLCRREERGICALGNYIKGCFGYIQEAIRLTLARLDGMGKHHMWKRHRIYLPVNDDTHGLRPVRMHVFDVRVLVG